MTPISNSIALGHSSSLLTSGEMVVGGNEPPKSLLLVRPGSDAYTDLGSPTYRWKDVYFSGTAFGNVSSATTATLSENSNTSSFSHYAVSSSRSETAENAMGVIVHDADGNVARVAGYSVITWIGSVEPNNAIDNDIWIDTA